MIILSVDRGDRRTGLALCDKNETISSPAGVLNIAYQPKLIEIIREKYITSGAEAIVVGLPLNMDGTSGESARKCRAFAEELKAAVGCDVYLQDERMTTLSAHRALSEMNVRGGKRRAVVDELSACYILDAFIAAGKSGNRRAL